MIAINSTNVVGVNSLYDTVSGNYQNSATVSAVLVDSAGITLYTFSLSYISLSNGNYRGTIPAGTTATLTPGGRYTLQITITVGGTQIYLTEPEFADYSS